MRARVVVTLVVAGALALGTVSAGAHPGGLVTGSDPAGDVTAPGLTPAERDAIDIVSITAIGKEGLGVLVTVTFKGNFAGLIGRGNLKNAAALVVLRGASANASSGVVSLGAGPLGTVLRRTRSAQVGAVRQGRQVMFFVAGPGYSSVASVTAEVLVNPPALGYRTTAGVTGEPPRHIPDDVWALVLNQPPSDMSPMIGDAKSTFLSSIQTKTMLGSITGAITFFDRLERTIGADPVLINESNSLGDLSILLRYALLTDRDNGNMLSAGLRLDLGGLVVDAKNTGPQPLDALRIGLLGGIHHTGARLISGSGTCGPGTGPSDVLCVLAKPLVPGGTATVLISTDKTYDVSKGVDLFGRIPGQSAFAGPFASNVAPTACACADIVVNAGVAHGNVENPRGPVHLSLIMNWTMACSGGSGACAGRITVVPPGDLQVTSPPGATAACAGKPGCPETSKGRFVVRMVSAADLHKENHDVAIPVKIFCKSGASFVQVRTGQLVLHFGAHALLDARHSDLRV